MEFGSGVGPGAGTPTFSGEPVDARFNLLEQTLENFQVPGIPVSYLPAEIANDSHSHSFAICICRRMHGNWA